MKERQEEMISGNCVSSNTHLERKAAAHSIKVPLITYGILAKAPAAT